MFLGEVGVHVPLGGLQGDPQQVRTMGQRVIKVLESRQPEGPSLTHLLPVVSKVASLAPDALPGGQHTPISGGPVPRKPRTLNSIPMVSPAEQTKALSKRLGDWLRYASVQQGAAHASGGFFSAPRARQVSLRGVGHLRAAVCSSCGSAAPSQDGPSPVSTQPLRAWCLGPAPAML